MMDINWPAILKHSDDTELTYIRNRADWDNNADLHHVNYDDSDVLIDSSGNLFRLTTRLQNGVIPMPCHASLALEDILGLIKAHAAHTGSCCVAKLYAPSIPEAFKILESLLET